jgi:hypothetical protein
MSNGSSHDGTDYARDVLAFETEARLASGIYVATVAMTQCEGVTALRLNVSPFICGRWPGRGVPLRGESTVSAWPSRQRRGPSGASRSEAREWVLTPVPPRPIPPGGVAIDRQQLPDAGHATHNSAARTQT